MNEEIVLGFDIGGTKIGVGLVSTGGKILGSRRIENKDTYPEEILHMRRLFPSRHSGRSAAVDAFSVLQNDLPLPRVRR